MGIITKISQWLEGSEPPNPQAPKPQKNHLFDKTGWGPAQRVDHFCPKPYRGPRYPKPASYQFSYPTTPAARNLCNTARYSWSQGCFQEAEKAYRQAISECPRCPDFEFELAQLLWAENRLQEAQDTLQKVRDVAPRFTPALVSSLRVYLEQGIDAGPMLGVLGMHKTTSALRQLHADVCAASPLMQQIQANAARRRNAAPQ